MENNVGTEVEADTFTEAEIHHSWWKVLDFHSFCFCSPARTRAALCPGAASKWVEELRVPLKLDWGGISMEHVLTRPTAGKGVFAVCSKNLTPHRDFGVSTRLCVKHVLYVYAYACAFLRAAITESTKKRKTFRRGSLLAKRTSLGLKRGHRLYATLPWRSEFHMPFPVFPSSIWSCFYPLALFRKTLCLYSCESWELTPQWLVLTKDLLPISWKQSQIEPSMSYFSFRYTHPRMDKPFQALS